MNQAIERITQPRYGLVWFDEYKQILDWVKENQEDIASKRGIYIRSRNEIQFPNGNKLILGYGDPNRYIGMEFLFVFGSNDSQLISKVRI